MSPKSINKAFNQLRILEERVRMSGVSLPEVQARSFWNAVKCRIAGVKVVFPLLDVNEIIEQKNLTVLPGCASWVRGMLNFRGRLLPVYGISDYFSHKAENPGNPSRQIIVIEEGAMLCGLIPDELSGMQKIFEDEDNKESVQADSPGNEIQNYIETSLTLHDEVWYQVDILRLARHLYHANPTLSFQAHSTNKTV